MREDFWIVLLILLVAALLWFVIKFFLEGSTP